MSRLDFLRSLGFAARRGEDEERGLISHFEPTSTSERQDLRRDKQSQRIKAPSRRN